MITYVNATSLPRLMHCGGSLTLDREAPDKLPSDDVIEGNAAHRVVQEVFSKRVKPHAFIGQKVNNNYIVTDDMVEYLDPIISKVQARGLHVYPEINTNWDILPDRFGVNGRADWFQFDAVTGTLYIDDLKYGWRLVQPENNWTLISHAIAFAIRNPSLIVNHVVFTIHQPRPFHPDGFSREWRVTGEELRSVYYKRIFNRFSTLDNTLTTGDHCYKCAGLAVCPAARQAGLNGVDISVSGYSENLSGEELGYEMIVLERAADIIKQRLDALESLALSRIKSGQPVAHWDTEPSIGKTTWIETATPETLEALTGVKMTEPKMITPAAAIRAGVPEETVKLWSHRPARGFKLVRSDLQKKAKKLLGTK